MRIAVVLLSILPICLSGCSSLVRNSGKDLDTLKTRDDVRQMFGDPFETKLLGDKYFIEDHITHSKLSEQCSLWEGLGEDIFVSTFGLSELIMFPSESYRAIRKSIVGQHLRFRYDLEGKLVLIELDCEHYGAQ